MGYITGWIVVGIITLGIYKLFELFVGKKERLTMTLNPQLHSRSATYIKRNGLLIRKTAIKSSHPFQCAYYPLTPQSDLRQYAISGHQVM